MMANVSNGRRIITWAATLMLMLPGVMQAQRYRQILVPKDRVTEFVRGLRPVSRAKFEGLTQSDHDLRPASFASAHYEATLVADTLQGSGRLQVHADHASEYLSVDGNLAILSAAWRDQDKVRQAVMGHGVEGAMVRAESQFDELEIQWNSRSLNRDSRSGPAPKSDHRFRLQFPYAFAQELQLTTPAGYRVHARDALVRQADSPTTGGTTWSIRWSGSRELHLRVSQAREALAASISANYEIRPSEILVSTEITLRGDTPATTLVLEKGYDLQIVSAQVAGAPVVFRPSTTADRVVVELPARREGQVESRLLVKGLTRPQLGELQQLPRIRPQCEWIAETSTVSIAPPLVAVEVRLDQCTCDSLRPRPRDNAEVYAFQFASAGGSLEMRFQHNPADFYCESLSQIAIRENSMESAVEFWIRPRRGELMELRFGVASEWSVDEDSIEVLANLDALPQSAEFAIAQPAAGELVLHLKNAATPAQPIRVRFLVAKNDVLAPDNPQKQSISLGQLVPVSVLGTSKQPTWIHVRDTPGLRLTTSNEQHAQWQIAMERAPLWIQELLKFGDLTVAENDLFLRYTSDAMLVNIDRTVVEALPEILSKTRVTFAAGSMLYELDVRVNPLGRDVDGLTVDFSHPTESQDWTLNGRAETPTVTVTQGNGSAEQHAIRFGPASETFELHFEFRADTEPGQTIPVPLAVFRKTKGGQGVVGVMAGDGMEVDIPTMATLEAIPYAAMEEPTERERRYRGVYRYDDTASVPPTLQVRQVPNVPETHTLIWRADLRSVYSDSGRPQHRADFLIQSEGASLFRVQFPDAYTLKMVEVNGQPIDSLSDLMTRGANAAEQSELVVPLPGDARYPCVSIHYLESERPLHAIDWLTAPTLETSMPIMQQTWQAWLPRDFQVYAGEQLGTPHTSWMKRLLGFFGSPQAAESQRSFLGLLRRTWISDLDRTATLARRMQILLGPEFMQQNGQMQYWGTRLKAIERNIQLSRPDFQLLIDRAELRRLAIFPDTKLPPLPPADAELTPRHAGTRRLTQSGLALVVDGDQVVVTSSAAAGMHASRSNWIDSVSLDGKTYWIGASSLLPVQSWKIDEFEKLWRLSPDDLETGVQQAGWEPARREISSDSRFLKIYHDDTILALRSTVVCFGIALGWFFIRNYRGLLVIVAALAFAAALLLPQPGSVLTCTLGWSLVASSILRVSTRNRRQRKSLPAVRTLAPTRAAVWLLLLGGVWQGMQLPAAGQEPVEDDHAAALVEEVAHVYVPVDENQNPGSTIYLPDAFYQQLRRQAEAQVSTASYLLAAAKYSGEIESQASSVSLRVKYDVVALADNVAMRLPDFGSRNRIDPDSLRVNDVAAEFPSANGEHWVTLRRRGEYRVSFVLTCDWTQSMDARRLRLSIPRATIARLELKVPRGSGAIRVPTAMGGVKTENGMVLANLGPASELAIIANSDSRTTFVGNWPRVTRFVRLFVGRDQTLMEVDFEFDDVPPFALDLELDRVLADLRDASNQWRPVADSRLRFQLPPTVGRFLIPTVRPTNALVEKTRVIVSSDGHKDVRLEDNLPSPQVIPQELEADQRADLRFEVSADLPAIDVVEVPAVENWNSELSYYFDPTATRLEVKAQLVPEYADSRMLTVRRLRVPTSFEVEDLKVANADGIPQRLRWHRNGNEVDVFFLDRLQISATEPVEMVLEGKLQTSSDEVVSLPIVEPVSAYSRNAKMRHVVRLYRTADVDVRVDPQTVGPFLQESVEAETSTKPGYRLHGVWIGEAVGIQSADSVFAVRRVPVTRNIQSTLTTRLEHDGEWYAKIEAFAECEQGIEVLYFDVPASLCETAPSAFGDRSEEQPLRCEVVRGGPQQGRAIIAVWLPPDTTPRAQTVIVAAKLSSEQTSLPKIRLLNSELRRDEGLPQCFVELPQRGTEVADEVTFVWRQSGLTPLGATNDDYLRFRVSQQSYDALLQEQQSGLIPEVLLQETRASWDESGQGIALSEFQLKPARETRLDIQLPASSEIMQVFVDGHYVAAKPVEAVDAKGKSGPRYEVPLTSSPWPQRLEVFYRGGMANVGGNVRLQAPRLWFRNDSGRDVVVPIREQLWHVDAPRGAGEPQVGTPDLRIVDMSTMDEVRINAFFELWSRAQASIRERPRAERIGCLANWARHLDESITRQQRLGREDTDWLAFENINIQYAEAFTVYPDPDAVATRELWDESRWVSGKRTSFHVTPSDSESPPTLDLVYPHAGNLATWIRYGLCVALLGSGTVMSVWNRRLRPAERILDHPHLVVATVGLLWQLFLSPSWIGAAMMICVAVIWLGQQLHHLRLRSKAMQPVA